MRTKHSLALSLMLTTVLAGCGVNRHDLGHYQAFMPPMDLAQTTASQNAAYQQELIATRTAEAERAQKRVDRYQGGPALPDGLVDFTSGGVPAPSASQAEAASQWVPVPAAPVSAPIAEIDERSNLPAQPAVHDEVSAQKFAEERVYTKPGFDQARVDALDGEEVTVIGRVRTSNLDEVLHISRFGADTRDRSVNGTLVVDLGTRGLLRVKEFAEFVVQTGGRSFAETARAVGECWTEHEGLAGIETFGGNRVVDELNTMTDLAGVKLCLGARGFKGGLNAAPVHALSGPFIINTKAFGKPEAGAAVHMAAAETQAEPQSEPVWIEDRARNHQGRPQTIATAQPQPVTTPAQLTPASGAVAAPVTVPVTAVPLATPVPASAEPVSPIVLRGSNRPIHPTELTSPAAQNAAQQGPQVIGRPVAPPPVEVQRAASQPLTPQEIIAARQRAEAEALALNAAPPAQTQPGNDFFRAVAPSAPQSPLQQTAPVSRPEPQAGQPVAEAEGGTTPARAGTPLAPVAPEASTTPAARSVTPPSPVAAPAGPKTERLPTLEELLSGKVD
jgi:hypothetical protein